MEGHVLSWRTAPFFVLVQKIGQEPNAKSVSTAQRSSLLLLSLVSSPMIIWRRFLLFLQHLFHCVSAVCPDGYCKNGGTCRPRDHKPYCTCPSGFTGPKCESAFGKIPRMINVMIYGVIDGMNFAYIVHCFLSYQARRLSPESMHERRHMFTNRWELRL